MSVRRLNLTTDPAPLTAMYAAAIPGILWPDPITPLDQTMMENLIAQGGWVSLSGSTRRAFILTPKRALDSEENAEELWLWIWSTGLTPASMKASAKELFVAWATDMQARGVALGWSKTPMPMETRAEAIMTALSARGMVTSVRVDAQGRSWRYMTMTPAAILTMLNGW